LTIFESINTFEHREFATKQHSVEQLALQQGHCLGLCPAEEALEIRPIREMR